MHCSENCSSQNPLLNSATHSTWRTHDDSSPCQPHEIPKSHYPQCIFSIFRGGRFGFDHLVCKAQPALSAPFIEKIFLSPFKNLRFQFSNHTTKKGRYENHNSRRSPFKKQDSCWLAATSLVRVLALPVFLHCGPDCLAPNRCLCDRHARCVADCGCQCGHSGAEGWLGHTACAM